MAAPCILIPALNPSASLPGYIRQLRAKGLGPILVVDDGSRAEFASLFEAVERIPGCYVLRHAVNLGKGRGLKNGFNWFLTHSACTGCSGVITVDSDGQHSAQDVKKLAALLERHPNSLILGCRDFSLPQVPFKSRFGNRITCGVFRALHGTRLRDTQTGLRAFPRALTAAFLALPGERFEYETNVLIQAARQKIPFVETPIETIYLNGNAETHFRPVRDSLAIYKLLFTSFFRYTASSLTSFGVDIGLFQLALWALRQMGAAGWAIAGATALARVGSSLFNYAVNRRLVFGAGAGARQLGRYYLVCLGQTSASAALVTALCGIGALPEALVKTLVDTLLFFVSYPLQQRWVFRRKPQPATHPHPEESCTP